MLSCLLHIKVSWSESFFYFLLFIWEYHSQLQVLQNWRKEVNGSDSKPRNRATDLLSVA